MKVSVAPIKTEEDFDAAVERLGEIFDAKPGTAESDEWLVLADLIEAYERKNHRFDDDSKSETFPEYVKKFGYEPVHLIPSIGTKNRVSEILSGRRGLSTQMMRDLNQRLHIPLDVMIGWTTEVLKEKQSA